MFLKSRILESSAGWVSSGVDAGSAPLHPFAPRLSGTGPSTGGRGHRGRRATMVSVHGATRLEGGCAEPVGTGCGRRSLREDGGHGRSQLLSVCVARRGRRLRGAEGSRRLEGGCGGPAFPRLAPEAAGLIPGGWAVCWRPRVLPRPRAAGQWAKAKGPTLPSCPIAR